MVLRIMLAVAWLAAADLAYAQEPSSCIKLEKDRSGGAVMRNSCTQTVSLRYCVDNPKSSFACTKQPFGAKTIRGGGSERIPDYFNDGAGQVYWAACMHPSGPEGWKGLGHKYTCSGRVTTTGSGKSRTETAPPADSTKKATTTALPSEWKRKVSVSPDVRQNCGHLRDAAIARDVAGGMPRAQAEAKADKLLADTTSAYNATGHLQLAKSGRSGGLAVCVYITNALAAERVGFQANYSGVYFVGKDRDPASPLPWSGRYQRLGPREVVFKEGSGG